MTHPQITVETIDERIRRAKEQTTAQGNIVNLIDDTHVNVVFDGSSTAMAIRIFGDVVANPGDRCVMVKTPGGAWTAVGVYSPHPAQARFLGENYATQGTVTTYTTETFVNTLTLSGLSSGARYEVRVGGMEYSVSNTANECQLTLRYKAGATVDSSGTGFAVRSIGKHDVKTPVEFAGTFVAPSNGQFTVGVSIFIWTGSAPGVTVHATFGTSSYIRAFTL